MFWVVQNNIYREQKHSVLMKTLKEKNIPHVEVKIVPFYDKMLPSHFDSNNYQGNIDEINEVEINTDLPIMIMGATSMNRIAQKNNWKPGSFLNENFHYENWKQNYGKELLNFEAVVDTFEKINPPWEEFFIRPCEDTKDFAGTVYTKEEFKKWRDEEMKGIECSFSKNEVMASPLKIIDSEYRFFVVGGKVVTYSQYKKEDQLYKTRDVKQEIVEYAQRMVDVWQPAKAFVIDVAETNEGLKVIEINNINSAGFYEADVVKVIEAIEDLKEY